MNTSIKTTARLAGLLYLFNIAAGIYAQLFARDGLLVTGNAAATAQNIIEHQFEWRLGFAVELCACLTNIPLGLIFYKLFNPVNKDLTRLVIFFTLVGT